VNVITANRKSSDDDQSLRALDNYDSPVSTDNDVSGVMSSGWFAAPAARTLGDRVGGSVHGVTVHRCRSDDTLSSMSDWRSRDPKATEIPRRDPAQLHRPPLSGHQCAEIKRQSSDNSTEDSRNVFSLSGEVEKSRQYQDHEMFMQKLRHRSMYVI